GDQQEVKADAELARPPAQMGELRYREALLPLLVMHDGLVARLDADQHADAARGRHLLEERVAEAVDARLAHPLETPAGLADERAEARRPLLIEGEGGVAEVDLADAVALDDVPELREDALRRLRAPRLALDEGVGAVVAARVGAAAARLQRGHRRAEQRVDVAVVRQEVARGEGQGVEVRDRAARAARELPVVEPRRPVAYLAGHDARDIELGLAVADEVG